MSGRLDADTRARRRKAWVALSHIYCHSEIRDGLPEAALQLLDSGYDDAQLESIFLDEVTPILHWNLKQIHGACDVDLDWLERRIVQDRKPDVAPRTLGTWSRWLQRFRARPALRELHVLIQLVSRARAVPGDEREAWARGLGVLVSLYFERPSLDAFLEKHTDRLLGAGLRPTQLLALPAADLYPLFEMLRVRVIDPREDISRARVQEVVARASGEVPVLPPRK
ncbi:MAG: hypothetical protein ABI321_09850 [Polyangia bacterium]